MKGKTPCAECSKRNLHCELVLVERSKRPVSPLASQSSAVFPFTEIVEDPYAHILTSSSTSKASTLVSFEGMVYAGHHGPGDVQCGTLLTTGPQTGGLIQEEGEELGVFQGFDFAALSTAVLDSRGHKTVNGQAPFAPCTALDPQSPYDAWNFGT